MLYFILATGLMEKWSLQDLRIWRVKYSHRAPIPFTRGSNDNEARKLDSELICMLDDRPRQEQDMVNVDDPEAQGGVDAIVGKGKLNSTRLLNRGLRGAAGVWEQTPTA